MDADHTDEVIDKWQAQSRKGFLELCLLSLLSLRGRAYGLEMIEGLRAAELEMSEGTLYPLLLRLNREGSLEPMWETPAEGHPRKYYSLTAAGKRRETAMRLDWLRMAKRYQDMVSGDEHDNQ